MSQGKKEKLCVEGDCQRAVHARGRCKSHYEKWRLSNSDQVRPGATAKWINSDGTRMMCTYGDCEFPVRTQGLCTHHYQNFRYMATKGADKPRRNRKLTPYGGTQQTPPCTFPGCETKEFNPGLCAGHYYQKLAGKSLTPIRERESCPVAGCDRTYSVQLTKSNLCTTHSGTAHRFSLTPAEVVTLFENPVCQNSGCGSTERLHIDHDHSCCPPDSRVGRKTSCGKCVRGWLCHSCNVSLGLMQEDPRRIEGLLAYLERVK